MLEEGAGELEGSPALYDVKMQMGICHNLLMQVGGVMVR